jgi:hypothetical protein
MGFLKTFPRRSSSSSTWGRIVQASYRHFSTSQDRSSRRMRLTGNPLRTDACLSLRQMPTSWSSLDRCSSETGPRSTTPDPPSIPSFVQPPGPYGPRVVGLILSGHLTDGTAGLMAIKHSGGLAVVQDPSEAAHPGMPRHALEHVAVDYCLPLRLMAPLLVHLAHDR